MHRIQNGIQNINKPLVNQLIPNQMLAEIFLHFVPLRIDNNSFLNLNRSGGRERVRSVSSTPSCLEHCLSRPTVLIKLLRLEEGQE